MKTMEIEPAALVVEDDAARARRKQAAVRELIRKSGKDGSRVFGRLPDDEMTREAWALGEAWRKSEAP
ncbi:hypothetical protein [Prosthecobacter sp.]|jgi:hypothetical protein|uniref:hypothetical protein n=1 Tax=Prosthecobacter sp. TaxID=1965333 RepID=UPI0025CCBE2E|nr:hypothetical protein [Prosthecobacter sp.]